MKIIVSAITALALLAASVAAVGAEGVVSQTENGTQVVTYTDPTDPVYGPAGGIGPEGVTVCTRAGSENGPVVFCRFTPF